MSRGLGDVYKRQIGDGALTGGLALEALNNIGVFKKNIIIVLNDNEMSISANVGGFSSYLSKSLTGVLATKMRYDFKNAAEKAPFGDAVLKISKKMENVMIGMLSPGAFFENLGIRYISGRNRIWTRRESILPVC